MSLDAQPRRLTPQQAFLNALADVQDAVERHHQLAEQLHKLIAPQLESGDLRYVKLTAVRPASDAAAQHGARSFTVINPYDFAISLGVGGVGSSNIAAIAVPPSSALTLPITAENLEVGADPANLAPGDAYINVIVYRHVQPFFLGAA